MTSTGPAGNQGAGTRAREPERGNQGAGTRARQPGRGNQGAGTRAQEPERGNQGAATRARQPGRHSRTGLRRVIISPYQPACPYCSLETTWSNEKGRSRHQGPVPKWPSPTIQFDLHLQVKAFSVSGTGPLPTLDPLPTAYPSATPRAPAHAHTKVIAHHIGFHLYNGV